MRTAVRTYLRAKFTSFRNSPDAMLRDLYVPLTYTTNTHPFGLPHAASSPLWEQPSWSRRSPPLPSPKRESPSLRDARTLETLHLIPINTTHLPMRETSYDSALHSLHYSLPRWRRSAFRISNSISWKARGSHLTHVIMQFTRLLVDWVMARMEWTRRCDLRRD